MNENGFNADLASGLRSQGIWAHKLPDLARAVVKPCDIVANCQGRFWMIEGKLKKVKLKPEESDFSPHLVVIDHYEKTFRPQQIPNLQRIQREGGVGFVAIYLAEDKPGSRIKDAWLWPIDYFLTKESWTVAQLTTMSSFPTHQLTWGGHTRGWLASDWLIWTYGLRRPG